LCHGISRPFVFSSYLTARWQHCFCTQIKNGILSRSLIHQQNRTQSVTQRNSKTEVHNTFFEAESEYVRHLCNKNINSMFSRINDGQTSAHSWASIMCSFLCIFHEILCNIHLFQIWWKTYLFLRSCGLLMSADGLAICLNGLAST
jgi:hypothetical protein